MSRNEDATTLVARTLTYAAVAHQDQVYERLTPNQDNQPYIYHPIRVAFRVEEFGGANVSDKMVALTHDILEDTSWPVPTWFSTLEESAVHLLTRPDNMEYKDYIVSIAEAQGRDGEIARLVKWADLHDNLLHAPGKSSLANRYVSAIKTIEVKMIKNNEC